MPIEAATSSLTLEAIAGRFGAKIGGFELGSLDAALRAQLNMALHQYGVLFYRPGGDGIASDDQFVAFAETFGEILNYPYRLSADTDTRISHVDTDREFTKALGTNIWHTDGSPEECPPYAAMLGATVLPPSGGNTVWADMVAAYEALSSAYQRLLDGLEALHTTANAERMHGPDVEPGIFGSGSRFVHPVVLTDPVTHRKMLYVNHKFTERLIGLSDRESESILKMLFGHINTPEFHIRWQWQLNDVVIWEERLTQHRAVADFDGRRVLRRAAIRGDRPR